jgi:hypothetical protein
MEEKMIRNSKEYEKAKASLAISFCPQIYPCKNCGYPVITGYCCTNCKSFDP